MSTSQEFSEFLAFYTIPGRPLFDIKLGVACDPRSDSLPELPKDQDGGEDATLGSLTARAVPTQCVSPTEHLTSTQAKQRQNRMWAHSNVPFDQCQVMELMARVVSDVTIPEGTVISPSTEFVKTWLVRNDGPADWHMFGDGVWLVAAGGGILCNPDLEQPVKKIRVGEEVNISIVLKSPASPGCFVTHFRLRAGAGIMFGQNLRVEICVPDTSVAVNSGSDLLVDNTSNMDTTPAIQALPLISLPQNFEVQMKSKIFIPLASLGESEVLTPVHVDSTDDEAVTEGEVCVIINDDDVELEFIDDNFVIVHEQKIDEEIKAPEISLDHTDEIDFAVDTECWWKIELDTLNRMGFCDTLLNIQLLQEHTKHSALMHPEKQGRPFNDSISAIVDELVNRSL